MARTLRLPLMLVTVLALAAQSRGQYVIYSQPSDEPEGFCSSAVSRPYCDARMADNFELSDPYYREVSELTWWGSSEYYEEPDLTNFSHWVIVIYDDVDGLPASPVYQEQIAKDDIESVLTGGENMNGGWEYMQTASLANPPTLFIGQPYWISVGAVADDPSGDYWIWSLNYFEGDNDCAIEHFDGQGYQPHEGDVAFVLIGDPAFGCPRAGASGRGCTADIHGDDCQVTIADLAELLGAYGTCPGDPDYNANADLADDGDPCVNLADLAELLGQYGDDCSY
jgi:hypothetical protein